MLGVTISAITGSENAMEKAQEARTKNDEGAMKDAAALKATNFIQEYYNKVYVENDDTTKTNFNNTGEYVIAQFDDLSTESGFTYDISDTNKLRVSDSKGNSVTGTILDNGNIEWNSTSTSNNNNNNNQDGGTTFTAYEIGDTITIADQDFYVIADSDASTSTVKLLTAKFVDPLTNKQDDDANHIIFDNSTNIYVNSNIKTAVDSYVASLGIDVVSSGLLSCENMDDLAKETYLVIGPNDSGYPNWWLDSPGCDDGYAWQGAITTSQSAMYDWFEITCIENNLGYLRPYMVIFKTNIPN